MEAPLRLDMPQLQCEGGPQFAPPTGKSARYRRDPI